MGGKDELTHRLPLRFASTQSGAIRMAEQKIDDLDPFKKGLGTLFEKIGT